MSRSFIQSLSGTVADSVQTVKSLLKVVFKSRKASISATSSREIIILGNGPSLNVTIEQNLNRLQSTDTMAVNFAANAPAFATLRPNRYILADPHFFARNSSDSNLSSLIKNLASVTWRMTLYVPVGADVDKLIVENENIEIERFNFVGADGFKPVIYRLYDKGLAMPRPRNVLIPAIMTAMKAGYKRIYLTGADHSWTRTLSVDEENTVISVQPHFYEDNQTEKERVAAVYKEVKLHEILLSFHIAFRSYHLIADYATSRGIEIYNATPGSFIDAFRRRCL